MPSHVTRWWMAAPNSDLMLPIYYLDFLEDQVEHRSQPSKDQHVCRNWCTKSSISGPRIQPGPLPCPDGRAQHRWFPSRTETLVRFQLIALADLHGRVAFLPFCKIMLKAAKFTPYPKEPRTVGDHLKKRRYELGLFQKDVAEQLGVTADTVLNWEASTCSPSVRYIPRIIRFLGIDPFPPPRTLGERIVAKRRPLGLSRKRLAKRIGVDEGALARWERDAALPTGGQGQRTDQFLSSPGKQRSR